MTAIEDAVFGGAGGAPNVLRTAFLASPRSLFIERHQLSGDSTIHPAPCWDSGDDLSRLPVDMNIGFVAPDGRALPATSTSPMAVMHMLHLLDVQPGEHVLEVGSGGGYVLALMSELVGDQSRVDGLEIEPYLVDLSRRALVQLGRNNVEVALADGAKAPPGRFYDRVIFNTGIWNVPAWLFEKTRPGAVVIAPLQARAFGNDVVVLARSDVGFSLLGAFPSWFVDPAGGLACDEPLVRTLESFGPLIAQPPSLDIPMPFGESGIGAANGMFALRTANFQSYLAKTQKGFVLIGQPELAPRASIRQNVEAIGLQSQSGAGLAVLGSGRLKAFGDVTAARELLAAYGDWTDLLMAGVEAFDLEITLASHGPPGAGVERRGGCNLRWSIRPDWPRRSSVQDILTPVEV